MICTDISIILFGIMRILNVRFNFKTYMGEDESNFIQLSFNVVVLDLNEISNDCLNFIEFFKGRRFVSFRISSVYLILFEF